MILVTGISGNTGSLLVQELAGKDIPLRAMVRDPEKVKDLSIANLEIVQGDFEDSASLGSALEGVDKAFMMMANSEKQLENEKRFIDAAKDAGVAHLVKLSASSADAESTALLKMYHGQAENYLAESGISWTVVRPNYYMQNMFFSTPAIAAENSFFLPMGEGRVGAIDVRDVAAFISEIMTGTGHEGQTYYITGNELLSFADMAAQMTEVLGREIRYVDIPADDFKAAMRSWGIDDWYVEAVSDLFYYIARDDGAKLTTTFEEVCTKKPGSFRDFVRDHAALFSEQASS